MPACPVSEGATPSGRFTRLLAALHRQSGRRVVVLVDEYDKPILDALADPETAKANRDDLRGLYGTIKDCDAHIELTFITGVSKFSKVSLFSDLNNLTDLTLDPAYFEFKVAERSEEGEALAQLRERGYADKHRAPGRSVHLIGVEVSAEPRDLAAFEIEPA